MKRCPECRRDYYDDSLLYCLDDGSALLEGPASGNEPATAILRETAPTGEAATRAQFHTRNVPSPRAKLSQPDRWIPTKIVAAVAVGILLLVAGFFGLRYFRADAKPINSIAVMPFVNESGNPDVDFLSDGMTDTLISSLSQVPSLSVKAHTSVFRYKGKDTPAKTIANDLQVQALVNGRVAQRGDQLRVTVDLVDPQTENVLWTQKYDRREGDVVSLQGDIARDVSSRLRSRLSGEDQAKIAKSYTVNPDAYQLYLKGRFYWNKRGGDNLLQAESFYKQAVEKDPSYALAYSGLAETYTLYPDYNVAKAEDSYPRSKAAALIALDLDDTVAEAHCALARYYNYWEWDRVQAEKEYRRAIELKPNYATAHHWFGSDTLIQLGRFDEALAEAARARDLDPLSPIIAINYGDVLYYARRYDEAVTTYQKAIELDPSFYFGHQELGTVLAVTGQYPEAIRSLRKGLELTSDPAVKGYLAWALGKSGDRQGALKLIEEMKKTAGYVPGYAFALAYVAVGDKDNAFLWINREIDDHGTSGALIGLDPQLDDLRGDPRFRDARMRIKLIE